MSLKSYKFIGIFTLLLCVLGCCQYAYSEKRVYYDALAFGLKGHVKSCKVKTVSETSLLEFFFTGLPTSTTTKTYNFYENGEYKNFNSSLSIQKTMHDDDGKLKSYTVTEVSYPYVVKLEYDKISGLPSKKSDCYLHNDACHLKYYIYDNSGVIKKETDTSSFGEKSEIEYIIDQENIDSRGNWTYARLKDSSEEIYREISYYPDDVSADSDNNKDLNGDNANDELDSRLEVVPYSEISKDAKDKDIVGFRFNGSPDKMKEYDFKELMMLLEGWASYDNFDEAGDYFLRQDVSCNGYVDKRQLNSTWSMIRPDVNFRLGETFDVNGSIATLGTKQNMSGIIFRESDDGKERSVYSYMSLYAKIVTYPIPSNEWIKKNYNKILKKFFNTLIDSLKNKGYQLNKEKDKYKDAKYGFIKNGYKYTVSLELSSLAWDWSNIQMEVEREWTL